MSASNEVAQAILKDAEKQGEAKLEQVRQALIAVDEYNKQHSCNTGSNIKPLDPGVAQSIISHEDWENFDENWNPIKRDTGGKH